MTDSPPLSTVMLDHLRITPSEIVGGASPGARGVVTLTSSARDEVEVGLSADAPSVVYVPLSVSIPQGELSGSFDVDTAVFDQPTNASVTATLGSSVRQ